MHYIADDLDTDAWVKAGLVRLEHYLALWRLFTELHPPDAPRNTRNEGRSVNKKLSCQDIVELVTDYIENALSAEERRRFECHLTSCPGCVTYVDRIRERLEELGLELRDTPTGTISKPRRSSDRRRTRR
jgi:hypothetical protein